MAKIAALGFLRYLSERWNQFDFFVVLVSVVDWVLTIAAAYGGDDSSNPTIMRVLRIVRVTRILRTLRVVRSARSLKMLFSMLILSLPALSNILGIFMIMLFMYSLLGMQLFGQVMHGTFINDEVNFCTFGSAAMALFRCATGESWNGLMHDAMVTPEHGCSEADGNCGSWYAAIPFFTSYVLLSTFIVLKMMIALILENYLKTLKRDRSSVQPDDAEIFLDVWSRFDPDGRGFVPVQHLVDLVHALPPPLGLNPANYPRGLLKRIHVQRYVFQLEVQPVVTPAGQAEIPFTQLLASIVRDAYFDKGTRVRSAQAWDEMLASNMEGVTGSKMGQRLLTKLADHNILENYVVASLVAPAPAGAPAAGAEAKGSAPPPPQATRSPSPKLPISGSSASRDGDGAGGVSAAGASDGAHAGLSCAKSIIVQAFTNKLKRRIMQRAASAASAASAAAEALLTPKSAKRVLSAKAVRHASGLAPKAADRRVGAGRGGAGGSSSAAPAKAAGGAARAGAGSTRAASSRSARAGERSPHQRPRGGTSRSGSTSRAPSSRSPSSRSPSPPKGGLPSSSSCPPPPAEKGAIKASRHDPRIPVKKPPPSAASKARAVQRDSPEQARRLASAQQAAKAAALADAEASGLSETQTAAAVAKAVSAATASARNASSQRRPSHGGVKPRPRSPPPYAGQGRISPTPSHPDSAMPSVVLAPRAHHSIKAPLPRFPTTEDGRVKVRNSSSPLSSPANSPHSRSSSHSPSARGPGNVYPHADAMLANEADGRPAGGTLRTLSMSNWGWGSKRASFTDLADLSS